MPYLNTIFSAIVDLVNGPEVNIKHPMPQLVVVAAWVVIARDNLVWFTKQPKVPGEFIALYLDTVLILIT